jgi:hypothetical protein
VGLSDISSIPYEACKKGHLNTDGKCVQGGTLVPVGTSGPNLPEFGLQYAKACAAYPVYYKLYVPYQSGPISGNDDTELSTLNFSTKLLRPYP